MPSPPPSSTALANSTLPPCPPKAQDWFIHAYGEMTRENLGAHYTAVLAAWIRLEAACRFENPAHKLSWKGRPDEVGQWINTARGRKAPPPIVTDIPKFAAKFWGWWNSLQPEWRTRGADGKWVRGETYGGKWDDNLLHWGINGTLSIVAALHFWGCAVVRDPAHRADWEEAVNDVSWILEGLATFHEAFKRRR
ncbi:hypothetical protein C8R43DRAFT_902660 [Mycena crocata]|nr:hypothetical protein C8R43DRAFT_902660 [Mycena crocata]